MPCEYCWLGGADVCRGAFGQLVCGVELGEEGRSWLTDAGRVHYCTQDIIPLALAHCRLVPLHKVEAEIDDAAAAALPPCLGAAVAGAWGHGPGAALPVRLGGLTLVACQQALTVARLENRRCIRRRVDELSLSRQRRLLDSAHA